MRIAIFSNTYPPTLNGVAVATENLREGLIKLGHEPYVFAPLTPGIDVPENEGKIFRYPALNIKSIANYPLALPFSSEINEILDKEKFDLVHTEHPWWVGEWGRKYALEKDLPLVTTVHTRYEIYAKLIPLPQGILVPALENSLEKYLARVDLVTTPGEGSKKRLLKEGVTTPIEVVSNATDLSDYWHAKGDKVREKYSIKDDEIVIGYVGRLSEEKNVETLLKAAKIILDAKENVKFLIVGDGPEGENLREIGAKISKDRIIFTGNVDHSEIPFHDAAFDVFLSASKSEVQPMTFAESMATGTPVVVFDVAGCNDMVEDNNNGRLVAMSAGAKGLAEAVIELISDKKELKEMSARAKKWAIRYELLSATKEMVTAYKKAINLKTK